jgi:hypothetical protein
MGGRPAAAPRIHVGTSRNGERKTSCDVELPLSRTERTSRDGTDGRTDARGRRGQLRDGGAGGHDGGAGGRDGRQAAAEEAMIGRDGRLQR